MKLTRAILWTNGMIMAFDTRGQQVPEYQGPGTEVIPRLRRDFPGIVIEGMDWATDIVPGLNDKEEWDTNKRAFCAD
jgi:hypothetical protein